MNLDYSHCLRKFFTHTVYERLKSGASLNLVGAKFTGRQRLLEDLQILASQEGILALVIDMNAWKHNYQGFTKHIKVQLLQAYTQVTGATAPNTLLDHSPLALLPETDSPIVEYLTTIFAPLAQQQQQVILLLNNFDVLLDNPQQRFPKDFFDDLNALRNQTGISLCCVTQRPHLQSYVHYKDEQGSLQTTLSWLNLEPLPSLPKLTFAEAREALQKELVASVQWQEEPQQERFVEALGDHEACQAFLTIIKNSFLTQLGAIPTKRRLKDCYTQYRSTYNTRPKPRSKWTWEGVKENITWILDQYKKTK